MDTTTVVAELDRLIGRPPVWNPAAENQTAEFDKWKSWSSKVAFRDTLVMVFKRRGEAASLSSASMDAWPSPAA